MDYATGFRRPNPGVTRILVHGVGGSTPADLLGTSDVERVAGDHVAGFYRLREKNDAVTTEAYVWGGLTSRGASQALWLLVLPFALVNVAGWLAERPTHQRLVGLQTRLLRVAAMGLSLLYVLWAAVVGVDLIAYQCAGAPACRQDRWWLAVFDNDLLASSPGRRMVLGLIAPLGVLALLALLGRRSRREFEAYALSDMAEREAGEDAKPTELSFWYRPTLSGDMALLHAGASLATLALLLGWAVWGWAAGSVVGTVAAGVVVIGTMSVIAAACLLVLRASPGTKDDRSLHPWVKRLGWWLPAGLLVAAAVLAWISPGSNERGSAPGFGRAPMAVLGLTAAVIGAVAVVQVLMRPRGRRINWTAVSITVAGLALAAFPSLRLVAGLAAAGLVAFLWRSSAERAGQLMLVVVGLLAPGAVLTIATGELAYLGVAVAMLGTAMGVLLADHDSVPGIGFRWMGPAVVSVLGMATLAGSLSGITGLTADWLDRDRSPRELAQELEDAGVDRATSGRVEQAFLASDGIVFPEAIAIAELAGANPQVLEAVSAGLRSKGPVIVVGTPPGGQWLAVGLASAVVLTVAAAVALWVRLAGAQAAIPVRHDGDPAPPGEDVELVEGEAEHRIEASVRRFRALARVARSADLVVTALAGLVVLGLLTGVGWLLRHQVPLGQWADQPVPENWSWLATASRWVVTALPLGAMLLVRRAYSDERVRRRIGTLWDVATFWPRRFHPWAPPTYADRAVPELVQRVRAATTDGRRVLLAGHSQGSVLAAATLTALEDAVVSRCVLVTHGSPLATFYRPYFAIAFDPGWASSLLARMGAGGERPVWRNFYRETDPIADAVFIGADELAATALDGDVRVADPWRWWHHQGQPFPAVQVHSDYLLVPRVRKWEEGVLSVLADEAAADGVAEVT
ncbi:MAG TPA: hypothetical protein VHM94_14300 [Acidimicrobiia bacterium]|nr:hypothetical protein [Acidimicrobiia bacterium]